MHFKKPTKQRQQQTQKLSLTNSSKEKSEVWSFIWILIATSSTD